MSDVFISYARSTASWAQQIAHSLRALGHTVWVDDQLPVHRAYAEVIEERLRAAKAVVVIWSDAAVKSQWVRAEANVAREAGSLVQLRIDGAVPPLPFNEIHCADLTDWSGDVDAPAWRKVVESVAELAGAQAPVAGSPAAAQTRRLSVCVLPFANMSDDPQQEYFSDGISEDIITDLSKVSALAVSARHTAFSFKGKAVRVPDVARQLQVSHVLEGSVRKAGGRVRITAQLIDGATGNHVWAERYDRDLGDIFALQDEISEAIVRALKLTLLPAEKKAIEQRGTDSVDAYNLYLMARQHLFTGNDGDPRYGETVIRLCRRATEIDPKYALAWALMARGERIQQTLFGGTGDGGLAAAERALALNPELAEAHAVKASLFAGAGLADEAAAESDIAVALDPNSHEVNSAAAFVALRARRLDDGIRYWERAVALMDTDVVSPGMLIGCYTALGDAEGARRAARITIARAELALAADRGNGRTISHGVTALAVLGEADKAKQWVANGLLIDPDNVAMRYNFACSLAARLNDMDAALALLAPILKTATREFLQLIGADPDLDQLRQDPRFTAMVGAAKARLEANP
jgi:adenylate cyclase